MKESVLAKTPLPQDPDKLAGSIPVDEVLVGDQLEGVESAPPDALTQARETVFREAYRSPAHDEGFRRLAAIQHVLEKEQRILGYRERDIHKSVRWLLDIVQGIEKRKTTLAAMMTEATQHADALGLATPDIAASHVSAIEQLAKQVEAAIAILPELPTVTELPYYKERATGDDLAQRKHDLLSLAENAIFTVLNVAPRNGTERKELEQTWFDLDSVRSKIRKVYSEDDLAAAEVSLQKMLVRTQVEHKLPDALTTSPDKVPSPDEIRADMRMFTLNEEILQFKEAFKKAETLAAIDDPAAKNLRLRRDLIELFNDIAPQRERFGKQLFKLVVDGIQETHTFEHRLALRTETGDVTLQNRQESDAAVFYELGSKRQGKLPKLRQPDLPSIMTWPEEREYMFNTLGEDYIETDPNINAMVVCDGNSTGNSSAEAARVVAQRVMEIFRGIPAGMELRQAQEYVGSRIQELAQVVGAIESDGGTTVIAARYFPEYNAVIMIDIGDCEAYITSTRGTERLQSSVEDEKKLSTTLLTLNKVQAGEGRLSDKRKDKSISFVRTVSLQPGEALSLITDGPRNNLPSSAERNGDISSRINNLVSPVLAGSTPNIEALPKALDTLPDTKSGDDEAAAILFAKAA